MRFMQAVVESPMLRSLFYNLQRLSEWDRSASLLERARGIRAEDEELALIAVKLRDSKIYFAMVAAVREYAGQSRH